MGCTSNKFHNLFRNLAQLHNHKFWFGSTLIKETCPCSPDGRVENGCLEEFLNKKGDFVANFIVNNISIYRYCVLVLDGLLDSGS